MSLEYILVSLWSVCSFTEVYCKGSDFKQVVTPDRAAQHMVQQHFLLMFYFRKYNYGINFYSLVPLDLQNESCLASSQESGGHPFTELE